jgi:hypothetical protein
MQTYTQGTRDSKTTKKEAAAQQKTKLIVD